MKPLHTENRIKKISATNRILLIRFYLCGARKDLKDKITGWQDRQDNNLCRNSPFLILTILPSCYFSVLYKVLKLLFLFFFHEFLFLRAVRNDIDRLIVAGADTAVQKKNGKNKKIKEPMHSFHSNTPFNSLSVSCL